MEAKATLVVDTSSMLDDLKTLKQITRAAEQAQIEVLIPQETIVELDRIKDRKMMSPLGITAREAINWISETLLEQDPRGFQSLRGQRRDEVLDKSLKADEAILDCAFFNRENYKRLTILISRDNNLLNRAVINGLDVLNCKKLAVNTKEVLNLIRQQAENVMECDWNSISGVQESFDQLKEASPIEYGEDMDIEMDDYEPEQVLRQETQRQASDDAHRLPPPTSGTTLQEKLINNISNLVDWHLKRIYGEDLKFLKYHRPNTSQEIARTIQNFKMVFEEFVPPKIVNAFLDKVRDGVLNKLFVQAHVRLLRALSYNSRAYFEILK